MNERINELVKQAGLEMNDSGDLEPDLICIWYLTKGQLERLAELIVRECAEVSREYADKGICSNHYDEVGVECLPSDIEYYVLNYFGVEE